ncbi:hypothetical protein D1872_339120 [compost metagenome]
MAQANFPVKVCPEKAMAAQRRPDLSSAYSMVSLSMAEISGLVMTLAAWIRARKPNTNIRLS